MGGGKIIVLGSLPLLSFHRELLHTPLKMIRNADIGLAEKEVSMFLLSAAVLLAFIPITLLLKRIFPMVLGLSRVKALK